MNTVGACEKIIKASEFIDDIYFLREKGGRSKESIVYQRESDSDGRTVIV